MKKKTIVLKAALLAVMALMSTSVNSECLHSRWLIENRLIDSKLPLSDARITLTCHHYEYGLAMQTIWIIYGKQKKQVKTNVRGVYALAIKPGKYKILIKQDGCDPLEQPIEIKNRERISIKVTFEKALDPNVKCYTPQKNHINRNEVLYALKPRGNQVQLS